MLDHLGDPSPEIRDDLVFTSFARGIQEELFTQEQFHFIAEEILFDGGLDKEIDKEDLSILERSFRALVYANLLSNSGMSTASLGENALANGVTVFGGFLFKVIATFLFVLVIMTVTSESKGNGAIASLVIGLSLMAMILVGLNITGLSVNPARSLAPAVLVGGAALQQVWIFILAPILGGILAALVAKNFLGTEE